MTLEEYIKKNSKKLVKKVEKWAGCNSYANDVLQDACILAIKNWDSYDPDKGTIGAWFSTILWRSYIKSYKSEKSHRGVDIDKLSNYLIDDGSVRINRDKKVSIKEKIDLITNPDHKKFIILALLKGYSIEESAKTVGLSYQNARKVWQRFKQ